MSQPSLAQGKHVLELLSRATEPQVQSLIENGDLLQMLLGADDLKAVDRAELRELLGVWVNPYADEKVKPAALYPRGWKVSPLPVQAKMFGDSFPGLITEFTEPQAEVPQGADGWGLLPTLSALGRVFEIEEPYGTGYGPVVERLCDVIAKRREFGNFRKGQLTEQYIRLEAAVKDRLIETESKVETNCYVIPLSFGWHFAGYSPRNARWEALHHGHLPLGSAHVACLFLAMPDRLTGSGQLWVDCPGDEYEWYATGEWMDCPCFSFRDDRLEFDVCWAGADGDCGSAVAFPGSGN